MEVTIKRSQEETEASIHSIRSKFEETIKHRMEVVLSCAERKMQNIRKELT
jgi:hypothetical protein